MAQKVLALALQPLQSIESPKISVEVLARGTAAMSELKRAPEMPHTSSELRRLHN